METFIGILLLAGMLFGGLAWWKQRSHELEVEEERSHRGPRKDYLAVEIAPGPNCCKAAKEAASQRLLLEHAPRLPLDDCDRLAECKCTYVNFPDRRCGEDRRNPYGSLSKAGVIGMAEANQRAGLDRRKSVNSDYDKLDYERQK